MSNISAVDSLFILTKRALRYRNKLCLKEGQCERGIASHHLNHPRFSTVRLPATPRLLPRPFWMRQFPAGISIASMSRLPATSVSNIAYSIQQTTGTYICPTTFCRKARLLQSLSAPGSITALLFGGRRQTEKLNAKHAAKDCGIAMLTYLPGAQIWKTEQK